MRIGVLALQGGAEPHLAMLRTLGLRAHAVVSAEELECCDGLVLPGGESTVQRKLLARYGLFRVLDAFVHAGKPVLATCAGLIVAAERRYLEVSVERNAYGSQVHSFVASLDAQVQVQAQTQSQAQTQKQTQTQAQALSAGTHRMCFIRAPKITGIAAHVRVLATLEDEPVIVEQGRVIGTSGHPELVGDPFLHARAFA